MRRTEEGRHALGDVNQDGSIAKGRIFFDMTAAPGEEGLDGLKVDSI
jgi:hypothetical protein